MLSVSYQRLQPSQPSKEDAMHTLRLLVFLLLFSVPAMLLADEAGMVKEGFKEVHEGMKKVTKSVGKKAKKDFKAVDKAAKKTLKKADEDVKKALKD
jgi:hypothetical protein